MRLVPTTKAVLRDCTVLDSRPGLDQRVLETLATHRYTPVTYRGEPVPVNYTFTIQLALPKR